MENKKKKVNTEKENKNIQLGEQLRKLIESQFDTFTDFRNACTEHSNYKNSSSANEYISKSALSNIIHGKTPIPSDRAEVFAEVLGVPAAYLLGYQKYPSKEAEENALWLEALSQWNKEDQERFNTFKRILSLLSDRQFMFEFQLKEQYEVTDLNGQMHFASARIISHNMQHTLIDGCSYPLDDVTFFSWLRFNTLTIKVNKKDSVRYYHLDGKIQIINISENNWIELDINSFIRMIYDIDESIKATIQNRCDFWMKYADYDYKDALRKSL